MLALMTTELGCFARDIASRTVAVASAFEAEMAVDAPLPEMIDRLAELTGEIPADLRYAFGRRLFERFTLLYPDFIPMDGGVLDFLLGLERHVHVEMRALYPDARPPRLMCERVDQRTLTLRYRSDQPVAEMCAGMIEAALAHFESEGAVIREGAAPDADAVFVIRLKEEQAQVAA